MRLIPKCRCVFSMLVAVLCAGSLAAQTRQSTGQVLSGVAPVGKRFAGATVTLYSAGTTKGAQATQVGQPATTDSSGGFTLPSTCLGKCGVLYLIARASSQVVLASVFGECVPERIVVNERTSVAPAYAMAQFLALGNIAGPNPGLANAAGTVRNMVDVTTGRGANVLGTYPNGTSTVTMYEFNSLANILASCTQANPAGSCETLQRCAGGRYTGSGVENRTLPTRRICTTCRSRTQPTSR